MDDLIEFIIEFLFEVGGEVAIDKKVSKWIRYPIIALITIFYALIIGGLILFGISMIKENILVALLFIFIGLFLLIGSILKIKKYFKKNKKQII